jgi:hypothetical protein
MFYFCCNFFKVSFIASYNLLTIMVFAKNTLSLFFAIYMREICIFFYSFEVKLKWYYISRNVIVICCTCIHSSIYQRTIYCIRRMLYSCVTL